MGAMPTRAMVHTLWIAVAILAVIGLAGAVRRAVILTPTITRGYMPVATKPPASFDIGFARYPWLTLAHIVPGMLFMILGPLQFIPQLRARHLAWHRWSGRVFVASGFVLGFTALALSPRIAIGGFNETVATFLFGVYFLLALSKAFWHIRRRQIALHREWMIRAFAIGLAVATVRPINGVFFALYAARGFLSPHEFFGISFWLGFTLHLIAAEAWIRTAGRGPRRAQCGSRWSGPGRGLR